MSHVEKLSWNKALQTFLEQNPGLKTISDPQKLEYFRNDLNVDLPPLIRDLMLKSLPDVVFQPTTEGQIIAIFALAREQKIPVTVRGAGTWGYGGAVPTRGGILVDLGFMDTLEVNPSNQQLTVGPGARFLDIHRELDRHGLTLLSMTSGKGGTFIGWMATGGMGFGTFSHGSVRSQLVSLRVITPQGDVKDLSSDDPEVGYFLSTEGQMGIIVRATLRVGPRPAQWFPFVIPFEKTRDAYVFVEQLALNPSIKPDDLIVYHSELVQALKSQSSGALSVDDKNIVLAVFADQEHAKGFKAYLEERKLKTSDESSAHRLWEDRFLPMAVKSLGPSLLASGGPSPLEPGRILQ